MTIAVIWQEDGFQWCAADTRIVGNNDAPMTEIAAKIYAIPVVVSAIGGQLSTERTQQSFCGPWPFGAPWRQLEGRKVLSPGERQPRYWTQYGFVFAGAASPASMTAVTASTFLQKLAGPGDPPTFEKIAEFVCRLAKRFMEDRRQFGADGIFQAAFFGWCPHTMIYKIAHIDGRNDGGSFRVELSYPPAPRTDGDPWLVLGSADPAFRSTLAEYRRAETIIAKMVPRRVIEKMVAEERDQTVGGATSIGFANQHGFELYYAAEPITRGQPAMRRIFNGLDLDTEIGQIGNHFVATAGMA
jgi:hypothetical protein